MIRLYFRNAIWYSDISSHKCSDVHTHTFSAVKCTDADRVGITNEHNRTCIELQCLIMQSFKMYFTSSPPPPPPPPYVMSFSWGVSCINGWWGKKNAIIVISNSSQTISISADLRCQHLLSHSLLAVVWPLLCFDWWCYLSILLPAGLESTLSSPIRASQDWLDAEIEGEGHRKLDHQGKGWNKGIRIATVAIGGYMYV